MIDTEKRAAKFEEKERVRKRMHATIDPNNYEYIPERKRKDYYDTETEQRVAIYVRVSTDDVRQTTSYELQKKYYEDFVNHHPNWNLVNIYADEGISGTSLKHRDAFNQMIADCKSGKIDLIITKSVSRFARNVMITIGTVRDLAKLKPPVGVFFESECIFSLNDDSQMALTFQATMAEEESHTRSRSMETSLRMRLDNGIPLTPKLLGYTHDSNGNLVINPEEAPTVKLAFYMYLFGYSTQQIADAFNALERKSYWGNVNWASATIYQILRNERHCGDVLTRKTFTEDYRSHHTVKNHGDRPQSRYFNHHEAIISRDDFIAVQRMLDNSKYRNRSILPELRVIDDGIFKGYVIINPRWAGFHEGEYIQACLSVYPEKQEDAQPKQEEIKIELAAGDFDLSGFEIARSELFDISKAPFVNFTKSTIKFAANCTQKFDSNNKVELLLHPLERKFAVRPTDKTNRNGVIFSNLHGSHYTPRMISASAFGETLYKIMGWNPAYRYRIVGSLYEQGSELAYIFDAVDSETFFKSTQLTNVVHVAAEAEPIQPLTESYRQIRAFPEGWASSFGKPFYIHEQTLSALATQSEKDWKLRIQGQLFETGKKLNVTPFETLRQYIRQELSSVLPEEDLHE